MGLKSEALECDLKDLALTCADLSSALSEKGKDVEDMTKEEAVLSDQVKNVGHVILKKKEELDKLVRVCSHFNEMTDDVAEWCEREDKALITLMATPKSAVEEDDVKERQMEMIEVSIESYSIQ